MIRLWIFSADYWKVNERPKKVYPSTQKVPNLTFYNNMWGTPQCSSCVFVINIIKILNWCTYFPYKEVGQKLCIDMHINILEITSRNNWTTQPVRGGVFSLNFLVSSGQLIAALISTKLPHFQVFMKPKIRLFITRK